MEIPDPKKILPGDDPLVLADNLKKALEASGSESIELMLKTVLAGAGSKQLEILLGRRLIARGLQGSDPTLVSASSGQVEQATNAPVILGGPSSELLRVRAAGPAVLVVEPQATTRAILRWVLEREGYQVFVAENGAAALNLLSHGLPQLVLQNLVLPDMDGYDFVHRLRSLAGGSAVPILLISDNPLLLSQARRQGAGFAGYLCQPYLPSYLLQTIHGFLPVRALEAGLPPHLWMTGAPFPLAHGEREPQGRSEAPGPGGRILVIEPNDFQCRRLVSHLVELGFDVSTARDGAEALYQAQAYRPDVIISDPLVPHLDGLRLCLEIRKDPSLANTPVILTSLGTTTAVDMELAQEFGAAAFVSRTPDFQALIEVLRFTLRKKL